MAQGHEIGAARPLATDGSPGDSILHAVLDGIGDGFFALDRAWRLVMWNPAAERIFGLSREDVIGRPLAEVSPRIVGTELERRYRRVLERRTTEAFEAPSALRPDRILNVRAFPLQDGLGAAFRDVTERRRAEEAVRESEERLRAIADHIPNGMIYQMLREADGSVRFTYLSQAVERLHGVEAAAVLADRMVLDGQVLEEARQALVDLRLGADAAVGQITIELPMRLPSGEVRWFLRSSAPRRLPEGRTIWDGVEVDITDHKRWEEHQTLLVNELNHRVKNTLATVQSIAAQSFRSAGGDRGPRQDFEARLFALSRAYDLLTRESWIGASVRDTVEEVVQPYRTRDVDPFVIEGPPVRVGSRMALSLSMALHELCTNAAKYGALSRAGGTVAVRWRVPRPKDAGGTRRLALTWGERGGPRVAPPQRRGFGSRLIERSLARELGGEARLDFAPQGVVCSIEAPLTAGLRI